MRGPKPRSQGAGKAFSMMVRCRIPGGRLTSEQMLAQLDLCDQIGNATMKITTRQTIQFHGVLEVESSRELINRINQVQLSTLAACGDVNRNIMCCPAKRVGPVFDDMEKLM